MNMRLAKSKEQATVMSYKPNKDGKMDVIRNSTHEIHWPGRKNVISSSDVVEDLNAVVVS